MYCNFVSELGREYLPQAGMFSQLPPKSTNDTVTSPIETQPRNKMYYGINSRSANSSNRHQSNNAIAYVDPGKSIGLILI